MESKIDLDSDVDKPKEPVISIYLRSVKLSSYILHLIDLIQTKLYFEEEKQHKKK